MTHYIKCSYCGQFVSYDDLHNGNATHKMITPDSDLTFEEWESVCAKCNKKNNNLCEFFNKNEYVCDCGSESTSKVCTKEYSLECQWANEERKNSEKTKS